jgi:hypothetical protein
VLKLHKYLILDIRGETPNKMEEVQSNNLIQTPDLVKDVQPNIADPNPSKINSIQSFFKGLTIVLFIIFFIFIIKTTFESSPGYMLFLLLWSLFLGPILLPIIFSFIFGYKSTESTIKTLKFKSWLVINPILCFVLDFMRFFFTRGICSFNGGSQCSYYLNIFFMYLLLATIFGLPFLLLGSYIKSRKIQKQSSISV